MVEAIYKTIINADLNLNPILEGNVIRITIPPLTQERRQELVKLSKKYAENCKVAIRNIRRNAIEILKKK